MTEPAMTLYSTSWCGFCGALKARLDAAGVGYREVDVDHDPEAAAHVEGINGGNRIVPTVEFPDGSTLTNPSIDQVQAKLA